MATKAPCKDIKPYAIVIVSVLASVIVTSSVAWIIAPDENVIIAKIKAPNLVSATFKLEGEKSIDITCIDGSYYISVHPADYMPSLFQYKKIAKELCPPYIPSE